MTNDFGYATVNANYHVFNYGNIDSNPGNSGGPLWYDLSKWALCCRRRLYVELGGQCGPHVLTNCDLDLRQR